MHTNDPLLYRGKERLAEYKLESRNAIKAVEKQNILETFKRR